MMPSTHDPLAPFTFAYMTNVFCMSIPILYFFNFEKSIKQSKKRDFYRARCARPCPVPFSSCVHDMCGLQVMTKCICNSDTKPCAGITRPHATTLHWPWSLVPRTLHPPWTLQQLCVGFGFVWGAGMRMGGASGPSCIEDPWWRSLYPMGTPAPLSSTSAPLMSWTMAWAPLLTPWSWAATAWATSSTLMAWSTTPKVRAVLCCAVLCCDVQLWQVLCAWQAVGQSCLRKEDYLVRKEELMGDPCLP